MAYRAIIVGSGSKDMKMCSISKHNVRFLLTLTVGAILSSSWFFAHYFLTIVHEKDSEIINYTGRLRFHTQNIGVVFLSKRYLSGVPKTEDPFEQLQSTVDGLLGITQGNAPEMLDDDVKLSLQEWVASHIDSLHHMYSHLTLMNETDVLAAVDAVHQATSAVDLIVQRATSNSQGRVNVIAAISIARAITGFLWALVVAMCFGRVYRPYVTTFNRLQVMERESESLLSAAFDAVVAVSACHPFTIITSSQKFDHLMGQSMAGKSVLSCAQGPTEEQKLTKLLSLAGRSNAELRSWFSRLQAISWWSLIPQVPFDHTPVASMINTCWRKGLGEMQHSLKVEVLAVNRSSIDVGEKDCPTLLVVRKTAGDAGTLHEEQDIALCDAPMPPVLGTPSLQHGEQTPMFQYGELTGNLYT